MLLRYQKLKPLLEATGRFKLNRIGKSGHTCGFRLFDFTRNDFTVLTTGSLACCYEKWQPLSHSPLMPDERAALTAHNQARAVAALPTFGQLAYLKSLCAQKGAVYDEPLTKSQASERTNALKNERSCFG